MNSKKISKHQWICFFLPNPYKRSNYLDCFFYHKNALLPAPPSICAFSVNRLIETKVPVPLLQYRIWQVYIEKGAAGTG